MIMSMCRKICVTNRGLAVHDFSEQIKRVLDTEPYGIILREKDLSEEDYSILAEQVAELCHGTETKLILHSFPEVADKLGIRALHMPLHKFLELPKMQKKKFSAQEETVHSLKDAVSAEKGGATYLTAGHIFVTDCKKGLAPRGLEFLEEVCRSVSIPVYAIGGIHEENMDSCIHAGAAGVCMMSEYMKLW